MSATETMQPDTHDIRPLVARNQHKRSMFVFGVLLAIVAGALFATLEMRRSQISSPSVTVPTSMSRGTITAPPDLAIPQAWAGTETAYYSSGQIPLTAPAPFSPEFAAPRTPRESSSTYAAAPSSPLSSSVPSPQFPQDQPLLPGYAYQAPALASAPRPDAAEHNKSARAGFLRNPATTVPQGTVIQAVLETALDSTRPGFARGLISRDVTGFDGSRVLIPRGSRLFGEYASDISLGQKRALIQWRRLTRPDGAIIDLDSPSADPLGRAGIKGKVNTHFFQRFGGAILQSVLDVGVRLATREVSGDTVVVAMPGGAQSATIQQPDSIKPTLKVRQGTSVSVMVARDLDFSPVED